MAPIIKECDFLVIGGGSGGLASARRASGIHGAKTIAVEAKRLGGTCVNVGCVPKKVTFNAAAISETIHQSKAYGFSVAETAPFDWHTFKTKRDAYIKRLNGIYERNLSNDKVEYIHGHAALTGKNEAEVTLDDGTKATIHAKKILLAVGGRPIIPENIPGAEHGINSDGFFDIEHQPKKVALVGAGYIAVEFAGMFNALGTETHLFIRHDNVLRAFDPIIQDTITAEYERLGVHLHKHSSQTKIEKDEKTGKLTLHYKDDKGEGKLEDLDNLIWAIGRSPEVDGLGLEKAGVAQNGRGQIIADEYQNTNVENIYSLGDVVGKVELTPVAIAAGRRLADRLFGGEKFKDSKLDYANVPSVVFAHPEIGSIGLSEPEAIAKYGKENLKIYNTSFTAMYYAMMEPEDKGPTKYKLITYGPDEKVVGLHILGLGSGEMLQGFGVAIKMGATKKDFDNCKSRATADVSEPGDGAELHMKDSQDSNKSDVTETTGVFQKITSFMFSDPSSNLAYDILTSITIGDKVVKMISTRLVQTNLIFYLSLREGLKKMPRPEENLTAWAEAFAQREVDNAYRAICFPYHVVMTPRSAIDEMEDVLFPGRESEWLNSHMDELNLLVVQDFQNFMDDIQELEPLGQHIKRGYVSDMTEYLMMVMHLTRGSGVLSGIRTFITTQRPTSTQTLEKLYDVLKRSALGLLTNRGGLFLRYERRRSTRRRLAVLDAFIILGRDIEEQYAPYVGRVAPTCCHWVMKIVARAFETATNSPIIIGSATVALTSDSDTLLRHAASVYCQNVHPYVPRNGYVVETHFCQFMNVLRSNRVQALNEMLVAYLSIPATQQEFELHFRQQLTNRMSSNRDGSAQQNQATSPVQPVALPSGSGSSSIDTRERFFYPPQPGSLVRRRTRGERFRGGVDRFSSRVRELLRTGRDGIADNQPSPTQQSYPNCPGIYLPPTHEDQVLPVSTTSPAEDNHVFVPGEAVQGAITPTTDTINEVLGEHLETLFIHHAVEEEHGTGGLSKENSTTHKAIEKQAHTSDSATAVPENQAQESTESANLLLEEALRPIGNFMVKESGGGLATELKIPQAGGFNACLQMNFERGGSLLIRFPQPGIVSFPEEKIRREVAMMRYVADFTAIPVPFVLRYGMLDEGPAGMGPFILMEYIRHARSMSEVLNTPSLKQEDRPILDPYISETTLKFAYVDDNDKIVSVIDWEFTYAAPAEFAYSPLWWLLLEPPEEWPRGILDWSKEYEPRLRTFLEALKEQEDSMISDGQLTEDQRLSARMKESWETGDFWMAYAARKSWTFDVVFWQMINSNPRFFEKPGYDEGPKLLSQEERNGMEEFVQK
ncbi:hypothetical protein B7463_g10914, partial [Scytalidium lignicola]